MNGPGDRDGDGFLEYARAGEKGLQNQGWKDSQDAVFHADGTLAEGPVALVEVQGYSYAARCGGAGMADAMGLPERAAALRAEAEAMRERFDAAFWCDEIGMYAIALDGAKRPCRVRTSNAAHVLWTGIAKPERAARIAAEVASPKFQSGWGVRTVAVGEPRYNPMSYHNGSIWPHDNALIAWGLARTGQAEAAERIFEALFAASAYFDSRRLPELFCGFRRRRGAAPTLYPVACAPQAWAAGTPFLLLQHRRRPGVHAARLRIEQVAAPRPRRFSPEASASCHRAAPRRSGRPRRPRRSRPSARRGRAGPGR